MRETHDPAPTDPPGPTLADRLRLVRVCQAEACRGADPWAASLALLDADLTAVGHVAGTQVQSLAGDPNALADPRFASAVTLLLMCRRQLGHSPPGERRGTRGLPPSTAVRPYRE